MHAVSPVWCPPSRGTPTDRMLEPGWTPGRMLPSLNATALSTIAEPLASTTAALRPPLRRAGTQLRWCRQPSRHALHDTLGRAFDELHALARAARLTHREPGFPLAVGSGLGGRCPPQAWTAWGGRCRLAAPPSTGRWAAGGLRAERPAPRVAAPRCAHPCAQIVALCSAHDPMCVTHIGFE